MQSISFYPAGGNALSISFGDHLDEPLNKSVFVLYHAILKKPIPFCIDLIPAYSTLTLIYDAVAIRKQHSSAFEWIKGQVENVMKTCDWKKNIPSRKLHIPVCYELEFAPDSKSLAAQKKISIEKLVEIHSQRSYRIFMIGFLPGFAYMGTVDKRIATPRLAKPRMNVAQGSVGIAGGQTGIYPMDSPGGWNIIGKTPVKIFDPHPSKNKSQVLLRPGDEVKFLSISKKQYDEFDPFTYNLIGS